MQGCLLLICVFSTLQVAAQVGYLPVLRYLLGRGLDVNAKNRSGMNPLMAAAAGGHAKAVEELLKHESAAKDVDTKEGWSALQHAAYFGHTDVCARLLE